MPQASDWQLPGDPARPYLDPNSTYCRIWRERIVYIGIFRAVAVQGAHPLALAGVIGHSAWLGPEMNARFLRNYKMMRVIGFAPKAEADKLLDVVHQMHVRINGKITLSDGGPRYPKMTEYGALDPDLLVWVLASIADSAETAYEWFVRKLSPQEREEHWQDTRIAGRLFGLKDEEMPRTRADYDAYMREMIDTDRTVVTDLARRRIGKFVETGKDPEPPKGKKVEALLPWYGLPAWELLKSFTMLSLPPKIIEGYGFPNTFARRKSLEAAAAGIRAAQPALPRSARWWPEATQKMPWDEISVKERRNGNLYLADADAESVAEEEPVPTGEEAPVIAVPVEEVSK